MKNRKAFLTGITGQDGSYLADLLLAKGYEVYGMIRRSSLPNNARIAHLQGKARMHLVYGDMVDSGSIRKLIARIEPDEVYNLAAQSDVRISFDMPEYTADVNALGALRIFDAVKDYDVQHGTRTPIYQASTSEMFGISAPPQSETTPLKPRSPYACSKVFAHNVAANYREAYDMYIVSNILFNHESERRGMLFVTRKITHGIARILAGKQKYITLGNMNAVRDWGYAPEYVETMYKMLHQKKPDDYVIGTGEAHTVREFAKEAFAQAGVEDYMKYIKIDNNLKRPEETAPLIADSSKARSQLGWKPRVKFKELIEIMLKADIEGVKNGCQE